MQAKFLHCADLHLGYQQYNLSARLGDFGRAFAAIVRAAIEQQVDFVILAGDLFQKRAIDALTLNQAMVILEELKEAGIPCIAVEGNHERAFYDNYIGWMEFLAQRRLVMLLNSDFEEGKPQLEPWDPQRRRGSYVDPVPGVRVYGMRWTGSGTAAALEAYAEAISASRAAGQAGGVEYTIFVAHAGLEGVIDGMSGGLSHRQWSVLRPVADYVALGHVHKPFAHGNWLHNPGSPEMCSIVEADWRERGYYLVEIDTTDGFPADAESASDDGLLKHRAELHANPRRRVVRLRFQVDHHRTPEALHDACEAFLREKNRTLKLELLTERERPIVELQLYGVLPFDRAALDLPQIEAAARAICRPLYLLIKNLTRAVEFGITADDRVGRVQLEHDVIQELFQRDARYQSAADKWTDLTVTVKNLAVDGADATTVVEELASRIELIDADPD